MSSIRPYPLLPWLPFFPFFSPLSRGVGVVWACGSASLKVIDSLATTARQEKRQLRPRPPHPYHHDDHYYHQDLLPPPPPPPPVPTTDR
ncbi:hypothetical protein E2C01_025209 [Portunus trituberculatus]|uniref:Uncharacterized protein n=1 Tax=Portunus trituberculatus TaxID=210409 RepID=A0A5B7EF48_PORTR|nr:hypothetical protein [Portunus trituberculatus]